MDYTQVMRIASLSIGILYNIIHLWLIVATNNFLANATRVLFNLLLLKKVLLKSNVYLNGVIVHNRHKNTIAIYEVIITI